MNYPDFPCRERVALASLDTCGKPSSTLLVFVAEGSVPFGLCSEHVWPKFGDAREISYEEAVVIRAMVL